MMRKHRKLYDEHSDKTIDEPKPDYLRRAKRAQSALYDGTKLLKPNHVPVSVPSSEESNEI